MMFRYVFPAPQSQLLHVNSEGQIKGDLKQTFQETFIYLIAKLNLTWISTRTDSQIAGDIQIEGTKMVGQGEADATFCALDLIGSLPINVSFGSMSHEGWCKIATFPEMRSSVVTEGPELAVKRMRIDLLALVLFQLLMMIHLGRATRSHHNILVSCWTVYAKIFRQNIPSPGLRQSFLIGFIVLLVSSLLIQTLFGSSLHTERSSITSFVRIDTLKDVEKDRFRKFWFDSSPCQGVIDDKQEFQALSATQYPHWGNPDAVKRAILLSDLEINLLVTAACAFEPENVREKPIYLSPVTTKILGGHVLSSKIPKKGRDRINGYIERSYEMGMDLKSGFGSQDFVKKAYKRAFRLDPAEECMSNTIRDKYHSEFSIPGPLDTQFFEYCSILYFVVVIFAFILHFRSLC